MASSRWKRFAFFDRKNLKLPHFVQDDVFPSKSKQQLIDSNSQPHHDGVSLVAVNGAGIPYASLPNRPPHSKQQHGEEEGGADEYDIDPRHGVLGMTATLEACNQNGSSTSSSTRNKAIVVGGSSDNDDISIDAMKDGSPNTTDEADNNTSLYKFTSSGQILAVPKDIQTRHGNVNGSLVLSLLSSTKTIHVHCIDVTVRCNPIHASKRTMGNERVGSSGNSGNSGNLNVHHPMMMVSEPNRGNEFTSSRMDGSENIEDLDGWRGYFTPFIYDISSQDTTSTSLDVEQQQQASASASSSSSVPITSANTAQITPQDKPKRIVAMAVCSDHETTKIKSGRNIYVACITNVDHSVGVTVHRNPHLYLNDDIEAILHNTSNPTNTMKKNVNVKRTPKVEVYQPWGEFDYKHRGRPTCVDISYKSGLVAVGTDTGMVLLYSLSSSLFNDKGSNKNSSGGGVGSGSGGSQQPQQMQAGSNGTKKLILIMEIPAPPTPEVSTTTTSATTATSTGSGTGNSMESKFFDVSCIKIVSQQQQQTMDTKTNDKKSGSNSGRGTTTTTARKTQIFVTYRRNGMVQNSSSTHPNSVLSRHGTSGTTGTMGGGVGGSGGGVCCYDLGNITSMIRSKNSSSSSTQQFTPSARYDLDGREVLSSSLCDIVTTKVSSSAGTAAVTTGANTTAPSSSSSSNQGSTRISSNTCEDRLVIARSDGLYTYSSMDKITVSPIDGSKLAMCSIPPPPFSTRIRHHHNYFYQTDVMFSNTRSRDDETKKMEEMKGIDPTMNTDDDLMHMQVAASEAGASYALIATTDAKSGRDAVDVYDISNKLVAFHILLSPGHKALRAAALTTATRAVSDGTTRGGLSSAVVITTGGSLVTLTEKVTADKVALLVQKNLYSAAISMAFADASYKSSDITSLFRKHAEHLYRKGDFAAAMDQYIYTIGSLEPSHVIFRFLDAPKIPLLTKYLEKLRSRDMATTVHCELLKTCYLKLNDVNMAEKTSNLLSKSLSSATCTSLVSNLLHSPVEALATICSFEAPHAVEALKIHGSVLARASPRETAGIVISLCDGVYSPGALASVGERRKVTNDVLKELLDSKDRQKTCDMYPVHYFSTAFVENPKLLRVILAHCLKHKRYMTPSLKRTLLELTLEEWSTARRAKNINVEKLRRDEAMSILSDPQTSEKLGDYETLVIVQQHNFVEGEILLYERLQVIPLLIEKYAVEGTYKARRQMLALCRSDPEILGDVLGYFVKMANDKLNQEDSNEIIDAESELGELLDDVKEALMMARSQKVLPPVRVARILAGDGVGQFRNEKAENKSKEGGVPLSVALDYIGSVLDEKGREIAQLQNDVEEYNHLCSSMEAEINELLSVSKSQGSDSTEVHGIANINIDEMYTKLMDSSFTTHSGIEKRSEASSEEFWRAMGLAEDDRFGTLARFFAKDVIE